MEKEELLQKEPYKTIVKLMWFGSLYAKPAKYFCVATGLSDRAFRKCVETMREHGLCIVSDVNGYYFPVTENELERYIRRTEKTARSYFYSLRSAKRELRRMKQEAQIKIEE